MTGIYLAIKNAMAGIRTMGINEGLVLSIQWLAHIHISLIFKNWIIKLIQEFSLPLPIWVMSHYTML